MDAWIQGDSREALTDEQVGCLDGSLGRGWWKAGTSALCAHHTYFSSSFFPSPRVYRSHMGRLWPGLDAVPRSPWRWQKKTWWVALANDLDRRSMVRSLPLYFWLILGLGLGLGGGGHGLEYMEPVWRRLCCDHIHTPDQL